MKTTKFLIALTGVITLMAFSVPARALVQPFVRGGVDFSKFNAIKSINDEDIAWKDKLKGWKTGYFGEVGVKLLDSHTISAELGVLSAKSSETEKSQVPILLNYRKSYNLGPVSLYIGGSIGAMSDKTKWREDIGGAWGDWKSFKTTWIPLYGATVGVALKVAKNWDLDVGVRALAINSKNYNDDNEMPNSETYKVGKSSFQVRPNLRIALALHW